MKLLFWACCLSFLIPLTGLAVEKSSATKSERLTAIKLLAGDYYAKKEIFKLRSLQTMNRNHPNCEPDSSVTPCVQAICNKLPAYECDSVNEMKEIAKACANNIDGSCVETICNKLPTYECDSANEMKEIAKVCAHAVDGDCIKAACDRLPTYECDSTNELKDLAKACSGLIDGSCVKAICDRLPSYECDSMNEIKEVIHSCKSP